MVHKPGIRGVWTEDLERRLKILWDDDNLSMAAIAEKLQRHSELKITRNAVIGKGARMGLPKRPLPSGGRSSTPRKMKARPERKTRINPRRFVPITTALADPTPLPPPEMTDRHGENIAFADIIKLESYHCRWPVGDPGNADFAWCGRRKMPGHNAYCRAHAIRSARPPQVTPKTAEAEGAAVNKKTEKTYA